MTDWDEAYKKLQKLDPCHSDEDTPAETAIEVTKWIVVVVLAVGVVFAAVVR